MPSKRKSTADNKDPAAAKSNRRSKKRSESTEERPVENGDADNVSVSTAAADHEEMKTGSKIPDDEARQRWPHRYQKGSEFLQATCHFLQAEVDGQVYFLEDDVSVKADPEKENYIGKIQEIFEAIDGSLNFTAQWYYRAGDTAIKSCEDLVDNKCIFISEVKDDNPLECLVEKLRITRLPSNAGLDVKEKSILTSDFYYDKMYLLPYTSFVSLPSDSGESDPTICSDVDAATTEFSKVQEQSNERTLLDLYSGCGAMSTGLCLGANSSGVKLVTKWAVDINKYACESLKQNHPETQVRHEKAEDFLQLLKEWKMLVTSLLECNDSAGEHGKLNDLDGHDDNDNKDDVEEESEEVYEVDEILAICYGDPGNKGNPALHFKIRWKGYGPEEDTWEPLEGLSACQEKLKEYVSRGYKSKMLPLPGTVDVICGGPPCQGISGFNRFRNKDEPLKDPKNEQLRVFMNIVDFLRPKFVLMENVVDIVKFADGFLGRYALGRLVSMNYQVRMGLMAAGAYGLPQFRMRMFMWGALPTERLPQYPLPTHNVVVRGNFPTEFEANAVAFDEGQGVKHLKKELFLGDAISDLPEVENNEESDEMPYAFEAQTDFQHFIRLRRDQMPGSLMFSSEILQHNLFDHRPLRLNQDDYERVCQIPKKKGANFRDLPGVRVRQDKKVEWNPDIERVKLTSGKPLVPDYAMSFVNGSSSKPFGRLWWDETVPTVVTRAEPHNQVILHPSQNRVLSIRENARLQGFPDFYKLVGPIKERYIQVGNAVAVPVARALGYSLAQAMKGLSESSPLLTLPQDFPNTNNI